MVPAEAERGHCRADGEQEPEELSRQDGLYRRIMEIQGYSSEPETKEKKSAADLKEVTAE